MARTRGTRAAAADVEDVADGPERQSRYAVRWLRRLLEEDPSLSIEEATVVASCLSALGGQSHVEALGMLSAMADQATRQREARRVAS
jgi:hypothetical protein